MLFKPYENYKEKAVYSVKKDMKFALLSDLHYIADDMITNPDEKRYKRLAKLCESALDQAKKLDTDTMIITGDLVNDGDIISNLAMRDMLKKISEETGKKIYVLTATHDFHHHNAYMRKFEKGASKNDERIWERPFFDPEKEFEGMENKPDIVRATYQSELWSIYYDFGPKQAISACVSAQSYCVELDDDTWCLMLNDCFRNEEALFDISPSFSPECFAWIDKTVKEAKKQGKFIFACTHHPMLPPSPAYKVGAGNRDMRSSYTGHYLADMGINLIFTGHSHFCDVGFLSSQKGNTLCDVTTPCTGTYPPRFRFVDLDGKNGRVKLTSINVEIPEQFKEGDKSAEQILREFFYDEYETMVKNLPKPLGKIILSLKLKNFYPICKKASNMTKSEMDSIADMLLFDLIINIALNMQRGDGEYTPDTPEYKFMMGLSAVLDSIIDVQPFYDLKKLLKGYSIREIIEPMLFNNSIPDANAEFDFTKLPEDNMVTPEFKSHAGEILMLIIYMATISLSSLLKPLALVGLPVMTALKAVKNKKNPILPEHY